MESKPKTRPAFPSQSKSVSRVAFHPKGTEKIRVFQRVPVSGRVFIHDEEKLYIAPLKDISAGGLFISQLVNIPSGRMVRVVVKSPKLECPVQAIGTVVRIDGNQKNGLAVEFTSLSSRAREVIQNCVSEEKMENTLQAL